MWDLRLGHLCLWKLRMCAGVVGLVGDGVLSGSGRSRKKVAQIRDDTPQGCSVLKTRATHVQGTVLRNCFASHPSLGDKPRKAVTIEVEMKYSLVRFL